MEKCHKHIGLKFSSIPLVLLYSLFFTIQVFYNFDTGAQAASSSSNHAASAIKTGDTHPTFSALNKAGKNHHTKIRLNKRFQPASAPVLNIFYVKAPVIFVEQTVAALYADPFHTSPLLFTSTLRGPPAVVYPLV